MTPFTEQNNFDASVNDYDTTDPVQGGPGGAANNPLQSLTNRTRWLYNQIESILTAIGLLAPINSPTLTGTPTTPTPSVGTNTNAIANMSALVAARGSVAIALTAGTNTVLTAPQYGVGVIKLTGTLSSGVGVIFPTTPGFWIVVNQTSQALSLQTLGGASTSVAAATTLLVWGDGSGIYAVTPQAVTNNITQTIANQTPAPQGSVSGSQGGAFWWYDPNTGYTRVWGRHTQTVAAEGAVNIYFPILFTDAQSMTTTIYNASSSNQGDTTAQVVALNTNGATVFYQDNQSNNNASAGGFFYMVDGYCSAVPVANSAFTGA